MNKAIKASLLLMSTSLCALLFQDAASARSAFGGCSSGYRAMSTGGGGGSSYRGSYGCGYGGSRHFHGYNNHYYGAYGGNYPSSGWGGGGAWGNSGGAWGSGTPSYPTSYYPGAGPYVGISGVSYYPGFSGVNNYPMNVNVSPSFVSPEYTKNVSIWEAPTKEENSYKRDLEQTQLSMGLTHPDSMTKQWQLGQHYLEAGKYKDALSVLTELRSVRNQNLDHAVVSERDLDAAIAKAQAGIARITRPAVPVYDRNWHRLPKCPEWQIGMKPAHTGPIRRLPY